MVTYLSQGAAIRVCCRHVRPQSDPADCCCLLQMVNMTGQSGAAVNTTGLSMTQLTDALRNGSVFVSAQVSLRACLKLLASNTPLLEHHLLFAACQRCRRGCTASETRREAGRGTCPSCRRRGLQHFYQTSLHAMMLQWPLWKLVSLRAAGCQWLVQPLATS